MYTDKVLTERLYPKVLLDLAHHIEQPYLPELVQRYIWEEDNPGSDIPSASVPAQDLPLICGKVKVYHSAVACYYAPSDSCGVGGMYRQRIRSNPNWRKQYARHDTVLIGTDGDESGMRGMTVGRVHLLFSFQRGGRLHSCALIRWFVRAINEPDENTGLWVVRPVSEGNGRPSMAVVNLDSFARGVHLIPVYGNSTIAETFQFPDSLDAFQAYYVNKYADHHSHSFII